MDLHYQREITVGGLVLVGIGLFVFGTMWLKGASLSPTGRIEYIRFSDIGTLQENNEVRVSGYVVGKVSEVKFEGPGRLLVSVTVVPELQIKSDATAEISTGLFANSATVILNPGSSTAPPLAEGQVIQGRSGGDLMAKGAQLADRADSVLIGIQAVANQRTADQLHQTLEALQRVLTTMNQQLPTTTTEAQRTMIALRKLSERLDSTLATIPLGNAIERADTLARNLSTMSIQLTATGARLDTLLQRINSGQGTLGKFVNDSGFYYDARATSQSLKLLIDELIKHPGKIQVQIKMF